MVVQPSIEAYEALLKRVKALEEEVKRLRNEKKETGRSPAEVELQPKTRDRKASRNSWTDIYNENTALRKHKMLLGQEVETDDGLEWRVKWGQRGAGGVWFAWVDMLGCRTKYCFYCIWCYLRLYFFGILYYKNVSFVIAKRLLRETNVVMILVLALCNWSIDIARPATSLSPVLGLIYMLSVSAFVFLDAVKVKSRVFVIVVGILFVLMNINNIYRSYLYRLGSGRRLIELYHTREQYTFMKRSVKRSIFIQIMLFSMNGIYTIFKDRKQELMIFATGHIYRETGTASKDVEDKQYS